jgi:hypothetical protein
LPALLAFAFAEQENLSVAGRCTRAPSESRKNLFAVDAGVLEGMRRVKAEAIEMEIMDPILRILNKKSRTGMLFSSSKFGASPHSVGSFEK